MTESIKIAIHNRPGSFSDRWIEYCRENSICHEIVNCYDSDIIFLLKKLGCNVLLWHWHHQLNEDVLIARHVLKAAEQMGIKTFPDVMTCWTFDDKLAQKYILEAVDAPFVPTKVFLDKKTALDWIQGEAVFPKVFKLRKGAGSRNVRLIKNKHEAKYILNQAFGKGFKPMGSYIQGMRAKFVKSSRSEKLNLFVKTKELAKKLYVSYLRYKYMGRESGYVLFQDFIPNNQFDVRIAVINGTMAFGFTRNVRKNDFRASGSGSIDYNLDRIPLKCVEIGFAVARRLNVQSVAFDFVLDEQKQPWVVEVSYGFVSSAVYNCTGYWDDTLNWHEGHKRIEDLIISSIIGEVSPTQKR